MAQASGGAAFDQEALQLLGTAPRLDHLEGHLAVDQDVLGPEDVGLAGGIEAEPWLIALGFGIAMVVSLVAAALPLEEAVRTPPLQGLSDAAPRRLAVRTIVLHLAVLAAMAGCAGWLVRMPAWNGLPIAAGIIFPIMLFIGFVLTDMSEFTVTAGIGLLIQLISMVILGFILQGDVPQEKASLAAA